MADDKAENIEASNAALQSGAAAKPYPARDAENGEEQRNRLGYMVTEPTEEEIEEEEKTDEKAKSE